jgi:hypothetical protein
MQWLCAKATQTEQKRCLAFLEFWINSIVVHTANNNYSYGNNENSGRFLSIIDFSSVSRRFFIYV